jgi:3-hydroxybutyryl-CoA dehydrogenase
MNEKTVGIVGSGTMGAGIAEVAVLAGYSVYLFDANTIASENAANTVRQNLQRQVEKKRLSSDQANRAIERLRTVDGLEPFSEVALVIEAIVEDLESKQQLFGVIEKIVSPQAILATNTSSLSITAIAAGVKKPERVIGMHFFNPAPRMDLVEVVRGLATDPVVVDGVCSIAKAWGKTPVRVQSRPGFIVNRVARPFYGEALRLLSEQASDPATIDAVIREAGGFRMGPFELMDLIGHDVNFAVTQSVFRAFSYDPRYTPSLVQEELIRAGFLGRKSGRGFYEYRGDPEKPSPQTEPRAEYPKRIVPVECDSMVQPLVTRLMAARSASFNLWRSSLPGLLVETDNATVWLTDGRTATERAAESELDNTVLVDLALDYEQAKRIALAKADQCSESAYHEVVGLFQAAGFDVSRVDDVAGMIVMRTVACIVNEAADTVNQGVCTIEALDLAMQKGVNYPLGPFAWADRIGFKILHEVLTNLSYHYGEDRYRISPLIRRMLWRKIESHAPVTESPSSGE